MRRQQPAPTQAARPYSTKPKALDRATVALTVSEIDLRALLNISRSHAFNLRKTDPNFPKPLAAFTLGKKKRRLWYRRADVEAYVAAMNAGQ